MYPVEFYRTVQGDRHARLGRLRSRLRQRPAPPAPPAVTVAGPTGPVVLSSHGVTRLGDAPQPSRRAPARR